MIDVSRVLLTLVSLSVLLVGESSPARSAERPNVLWITSEDNGPELGCYGDEYAVTPHIDALASRSLRFERCWSNSPVCASARTTLISGMYACSLGGEHMRSGVKLPPDVQLYPSVLRDLGYYCTNNNKTDYNFTSQNAGWHDSSKNAHWRNRPNQQTPFFSVFNFTNSHESQIRNRPHTLVHDPARAPLPAYHPDTPEVRRDWAQYYDRLSEMDAQVGRILQELARDGLADSTIVFYFGDHGSGMPRSKRWPFNSGLHVPLLIHVPERFLPLAPPDYVAGGTTSRLVSFVDFAPTVIKLAGGTPPATMQGTAFAGPHPQPPKPWMFGFRGRMDERIDMVRTCTDGEFVYMKHFYPDRPYLKHVSYMFETPTTRVWKSLFDAGELNETQAKYWQPKPCEELFDLRADPDEVVNLAEQPQHQRRLETMRSAVKDWMIEIADAGLLPEAQMHARCGDAPPRSCMTDDAMPLERIAEAAWLATSSRTENLPQVIEASQHPDPTVQFWGVRGLTLRATGPEHADAIRKALLECLESESPSVQVAACEGLLALDDPKVATTALERLLQLADVTREGDFVAVAALGVLDVHAAKLSGEQWGQIEQLPREPEQPPVRAGGYVGRLLDHLATLRPSP